MNGFKHTWCVSISIAMALTDAGMAFSLTIDLEPLHLGCRVLLIHYQLSLIISLLSTMTINMFHIHLGHVLPRTWDQVSPQGNLVPFSEKWCLRMAVWAAGVLTHYSWFCCHFSAFSVGATRARKSLFHGYETHKYVVCEYYLK